MINFPTRVLFKFRPTYQSPHLTICFIGLSRWPSIHQAGSQTSRCSCCALEPTKITRATRFYPAYLALLAFPHGNHSSGYWSQTTPNQCWCLHGWPSMVGHTPSSWELWLPRCPVGSSHLLLCWSYCASHFLQVHPILKQYIVGPHGSSEKWSEWKIKQCLGVRVSCSWWW